MEVPPEQLSLPLFEPIQEQHAPRSSERRPPKRRPRRRVASSRPRSQAAEVITAAPTLLTTQEAAEALRVHPRTVQRLVERGELSAVHLGTAVRFDPSDVAELTARLKTRAAGTTSACADVVRPSRPVRISFADRLRVQA